MGGGKRVSFSEDCKRYLSTQLHCRHRKHCLWNILLFVSTFSRGYTFFSQLSHTSVQLAWISCVDFRLEESKISGEQKKWCRMKVVCDGLMRKVDERVHCVFERVVERKDSKDRLSLTKRNWENTRRDRLHCFFLSFVQNIFPNSPTSITLLQFTTCMYFHFRMCPFYLSFVIWS